MNADFTMAYAILTCYKQAQKEIRERGLTFDEFVEYFERGITNSEKQLKERKV